MLRKRSKGVANKSQHMLGKAMDFYIPGVPLKKLRDAGLRAQAGGVGYYPRSGSPFIHMDVGNVRHWPRMSRKELVAVFPNGKTLHVPTDGKPLPGFETALASYEARKKNGTTALALASNPAKSSKSGGLLSALFGGGADEEEDNNDSGEGTVVAALPPARAPKPSAAIQVVPPELANPATAPFAEAEDATPMTIIAALPEREVPLPVFAPRPQAEVGPAVAAAPQPESVPFAMASAALPEEGVEAFDEEADANIPLPTWRPETGDLPAPVLASLTPSEAAPAPEELSLAGLSTSEEGDIEAATRVNSRRLAVLQKPAAVEDAIAALASDDKPVLSPGGVKTTAKSARARAGDNKPSPKPLVVAAQPEAARWALGEDAQLVYAANGPAVASEMVRSVPSEVYAAGFQRDTVVADAGRFSGKAITFMPVARFQTN